jgi:hypothetical protein
MYLLQLLKLYFLSFLTFKIVDQINIYIFCTTDQIIEQHIYINRYFYTIMHI